MEILNGKDQESSKERLVRIAHHIRATNHHYKAIPVDYYLMRKEVDMNKLGQTESPETIKAILDRISVATSRSKILVMRLKNGLKAYFADTAAGDFMIRAGVNVVGVFDKHSTKETVERILKKSMLK